MYQRNLRKNPQPSSVRDNVPASKRPRVGSLSKKDGPAEDDDDPFDDDDITGEELEEWEFVASQAEIKLTQEQCKESHKASNGHNGMGNGATFKAPAPRTNRSDTNSNLGNMKVNNNLVKEMESKLALYEKKIKEIEQSYKRKDGETMVLRDRLSRAEKNLNQERTKIVNMQQQHDEAEAEREKQIQKKLEKYKDQLQFKHVEILESENLIRNLEAKNKLLEQQKSARLSSESVSNSNKSRSLETGCTSTESARFAAKKIRLVKPESPKIQSSRVLKVDFSDDPLGRKKANKHSPSKPLTSNCEMSDNDAIPPTKLQLKSEHFSKDSHDRAVLCDLLSSTSTLRSYKSSDITSPLLYLLRKKQPSAASYSLKNILSDKQEEMKIFGQLCQPRYEEKNSVCTESTSEILELISTLLSAYISLQDLVLKNPILSQESTPFQTASSEPMSVNGLTIVPSPGKVEVAASSTICKDAYAALQVLHTLTSHSQRTAICVSSNSPALLGNTLKICDTERWHLRLELCEDITTVALTIVAVLAKSAKDCPFVDRFAPFMKTELLMPLVVHHCFDVKCHLMDTLMSLVYHPPFARIIAKQDQQTDMPGILCHICDLLCGEQHHEVQEDTWLSLLSKIVTVLSILVAKHETLLVENYRFSDIYHAADVLLYNQLMLWGKDSQPHMRSQLIKSALCLLHSCANVYADGIPGSRRDHRHQFTLTNLERYLSKDADQSSFWSQELNRIVKSEVKAIFEEAELS